MKRITAALSVALILSLCMSACRSQPAATAAPTAAPTAAATATPAPAATAAPLQTPAEAETDGGLMYPVPGDRKLTMMKVLDQSVTLVGFTGNFEAPIFVEWQKQSGVTIDLVEPADTTALLLALSSGDVPDLIHGSRTMYPGGLTKMAEDGLAIDIFDKLPEWAPDYWNMLQSSEIYMKNAMTNMKYVYGIGGYNMPIDSPFRTWLGMIARQEYLDAVGMDEIVTNGDLYDFLVAARDQLDLTPPFSTNANYINSILTDGRITSAYGLVSSGHYQVNGEYRYGAFEPEYKDALAYLYMLFTEQLLDNNVQSNVDDITRAAMINGEAALCVGATSWIAALSNAAEDDPYTLTGLTSLVANKGEKPLFGHADKPIVDASWYFITDACQDIEAAMKFAQYLLSPDGLILGNYGTEGKTFEYIGGKPTFTDFMNNNPDGHTRDQLTRAWTAVNWNTIHLLEMSMQRFPLEMQRKAISNWFVPSRDVYAVINDDIDPAVINEYTTLWNDIGTYINESRIRFITGEEPLSNFDNYLETLERMGMNRVMEIRQQSYDLNN